jgi:hypothetical protein
LKDHYHVLPKQSTYPDDLVDMEYVGADTAHKAWNETLEKEEPGYDTFAGAMSFRITPNVYQYKRVSSLSGANNTYAMIMDNCNSERARIINSLSASIC